MSESKNNEKKTGISILDSTAEDIRSGKVKVNKQSGRNSAEKANRRKRRTIYIVSVVAVSILLACVILPRMLFAVNEMLVHELRIEETDITDYQDGVYTAQYTNAHMSATVSVTIISGKMNSITLDDFTGIDPARANVIFERVIYYQMLNIPPEDTAEILTQTTDFIILKAIETALASGTYSAAVAV